VYKADGAGALNVVSAWLAGVPAAAGDVAVWDGNVLGAYSSTLGAATSWQGIRIGDANSGNPGGAVTIAADGNALTLGSAGVDLSLATQNLTIAAPVTLGAAQTWNVGAGRTVTAQGMVTSNGVGWTKAGAGTVSFTSAPLLGTSPIALNGGVVTIGYFGLGTGTITFNGGTITNLAATGNQPELSNSLYVPAGQTGTINMNNRLAWSDKATASVYTLTGAGTINFTGNTTVSRNDIFGDCYAFAGQMNLTGSGTWRVFINGGHFGGGMPNGSLDLEGSVAFSPQTNSSGNTISFGTLSGSSTAATLAGSTTAGTMTYSVGNLGATSSFAGGITGIAALTKVGAGSLTLTNSVGSLTYTGATTVSGGLLLLDGVKSGSGVITVGNGGTFGGTGSVTAGTTVVAAGGRLSPGDGGVGTLSLSALTFSNAATGTFEFGASANDALASSGVLTFLGTTSLALYNEGTTSPFAVNGTYNLFQYGSLAGTNPATALTVAAASQVAGKTYAFGTSTSSGNFVTLTISGNAPSYWNVDSDGQWGTNANWLGGAPDGSGSYAGFVNPSLALSAQRTITLGANRTVGTIAFSDPTGVVVSGGGVSNVTLDNAGSTANITMTGGNNTIAAPLVLTSFGANISVSPAGKTLTLGGGISGPGSVAISGAGAVTLGAASTYGGATTISGTSVKLAGGANTLPSTTDLTNNGAIDLNGNSQTFSSLSGTGTLTNGGASDAVLALTNPSTITGVISDGATNKVSVSYSGGGVTTVSLNQAYSGGTTLGAGGSIAIPVSSLTGNLALGTGPLLLQNGSTLNLSYAGSTNSLFIINASTIAPGATATFTSASAGAGFGMQITFGDATSVLNIGNGNVSLSAATSQFGASAGTVLIPAGSNLRFSSTALNGNGGTNVTFTVNGGISSRNAGTIVLGALQGSGGIYSGVSAAVSSTLLLDIGGANLYASYAGSINDGNPTTNATTGTATNHYTAVTKLGTGTQTFSGNLNYSGNTTVSTGELIFASPWRPVLVTNAGSASLVVAAGGTALVAVPTGTAFATSAEVNGITVNGSLALTPVARTGGTAQAVVVANTLTIASTGGTYTGSFDLGNGDLILHNATAAAVQALLQGGALRSSVAGTGTGPDLLAGLGSIVNSDGRGGALYASFDGVSVTPTDVLVKYTYLGDTNLDGTVDANDLATALAGLSGGLTGWGNGDFNHDGSVTSADITLLLNSLSGQTTSFGNPGSGTGAVPEPASMAIAMAALPSLSRRRRA
jgi:autotransporter-associated beta strand protein